MTEVWLLLEAVCIVLAISSPFIALGWAISRAAAPERDEHERGIW